MRNNWTREQIIRTLLEREAKSLPLSVGGQGIDKSLYGAARRIFGSWRNAIQAAGIAPREVLTWERWSPARILVMIRHLARRERPLTTEQMERRYHNLVTAARRHFGSWSKAILAAGVKPTKLQRVVPWNEERVIEAILTRTLRSESLVARLVEPRSLVEAGQRFFGGWSLAVRAAGVDTSLTESPSKRLRQSGAGKPRKAVSRRSSVSRLPWTKEKIVSAILARQRDGRPLYANAVVREDQSLYHAARRHLGSWNEAMRSAGLDPEAHRRGPASRTSSNAARRNGDVALQSRVQETLRPDQPA